MGLLAGEGEGRKAASDAPMEIQGGGQMEGGAAETRVMGLPRLGDDCRGAG